MDLITLARTAATLKSITKEDLCGSLQRLELLAASEAVRKIYLSRDANTAITSAITHLETAEAVSIQRSRDERDIKLLGKKVLTYTGVSLRPHEIRFHYFTLFYIYALMSTLYYIRDERKLMIDSIKKLLDAQDEFLKFKSTVDFVLGQYLHPSNLPYINKPLPIEGNEISGFLEATLNWGITDAEAEAAREDQRPDSPP